MNKNTHHYRLLTLDMDGTLLDSDQRIPDDTAAAIDELLGRGIHVSLATGRGMAEVEDYMESLPRLRYGILSSGSLVYDFLEKKSIFFRPLQIETVMELMEVGEAEQAMIHMLTLRGSIARGSDISHMELFHMGRFQHLFEEICEPVEDLVSYVGSHPNEITKLNLYHRSGESRERSARRLGHLGLSVVYTDSMGLEFSPPGISKASGLHVLCEHLGISPEDAVSVGDGLNDMEILQTAGLSLAMGNAREEIKALADAIVADNDHGGVLEAIRTYF